MNTLKKTHGAATNHIYHIFETSSANIIYFPLLYHYHHQMIIFLQVLQLSVVIERF